MAAGPTVGQPSWIDQNVRTSDKQNDAFEQLQCRETGNESLGPCFLFLHVLVLLSFLKGCKCAVYGVLYRCLFSFPFRVTDSVTKQSCVQEDVLLSLRSTLTVVLVSLLRRWHPVWAKTKGRLSRSSKWYVRSVSQGAGDTHSMSSFLSG